MSKKYFSKIGTGFVVGYLLIVGGIWLFISLCHTDWCGIAPMLIFLFTVVPWQILLDIDNVPIGIAVSQVLNIAILYLVGLLLMKLISKYKFKKSNSLIEKNKSG